MASRLCQVVSTVLILLFVALNIATAVQAFCSSCCICSCFGSALAPAANGVRNSDYYEVLHREYKVTLNFAECNDFVVDPAP